MQIFSLTQNDHPAFFSTTPSDPQFALPSLHQLRHCPIWCLDGWKMMAIATKGNAGKPPYFFLQRCEASNHSLFHSSEVQGKIEALGF